MSHSATVDLRLILSDGTALDVSQTGPTSLILRHSRDLAPQPATLVVTVDGARTESRVRITRSAGREVWYMEKTK